jgi:hypothetical protein
MFSPLGVRMSWKTNGLAAVLGGLFLFAMLWIARLRHPTPTCILPPHTFTADQLAQVRDLVDRRKRLADELQRIIVPGGDPSEDLMTRCPGPWSLREKRSADAPLQTTQPTSQPSTASGM